MIKIKITNKHNRYDYPSLRRCFSGLVRSSPMLSDYSIQLVNGGSYDYEFIDKNCFMDRHKTLSESIDMGLKYLSNKTGDYFLFDGGDDTSLMASYEVFSQSNAKGLFKKQLLNRDSYNIPSFLGMWFRSESNNKLKYDIPKNTWNNINLTGYNLGHEHPNLTNKLFPINQKDIDVVGIWQGKHKYNKDYGVENHNGYTQHRVGCWDELKKLENKYNIVLGQFNGDITNEAYSRAKVGISPFGQGELCFRDFELVQHGVILLKPHLENLLTSPNWLVPNETYIPVKKDWSDLNEIIEKILGNYKDYSYIIENARLKMIESYKLENVCLYWYNFFNNLDEIKNE